MALPPLQSDSLKDELPSQAAVSTLTSLLKNLKIKTKLKVYIYCPKFWRSGHKCLAFPYPTQQAHDSQLHSVALSALFPAVQFLHSGFFVSSHCL